MMEQQELSKKIISLANNLWLLDCNKNTEVCTRITEKNRPK